MTDYPLPDAKTSVVINYVGAYAGVKRTDFLN